MEIIPYQYVYFLGSLYFIPIWVWLYLRLPQHRKFMVFGGATYMWLGFAANYLWWVRDWWHPITITGTVVGIEDIIMSFTHLSIPIFIYKYVFSKDMEENINFSWKQSVLRFFIVMALLFGIIILAIYYFKINSFISTTLALFLTTVFMIFKRSDLLIPAYWSAALMVVLTFPIYIVGSFFVPEAIKIIWDQKISGIIFWGYPVEDIIWYAAIGFFFGVVYEFVADRKIGKLKTNNLKKDLSILYNFIFHPGKISM